MSASPLTINAHPKDGYSHLLESLESHDHDQAVDEKEPVSVQRHTRMVKRSSGRSDINHVGIPPRGFLGFLTDGFTTLINSRWSVVILFFCALYVVSWLVFGCVWTLIAYGSDRYNSTCIVNVQDFSSAFLFSVETEVTIGYGNKYVASDCHVGIFFVVLQSLIGLMIDSVLLGLIFAKLTRPRNRRNTIMFSRVAVIYEKDGRKVLEFQIADIRRSQIVESHVRLQLYWYRLVDPVNNLYEFQTYDLDVGFDTGRDRVFLITPTSIYHYINEESPLYGITPEKLAAMDMEMVVILEGMVEATGLTAQALWSYTREEFLFDRRFVSTVTRRGGKWKIDFSKISKTMQVSVATSTDQEIDV